MRKIGEIDYKLSCWSDWRKKRKESVKRKDLPGTCGCRKEGETVAGRYWKDRCDNVKGDGRWCSDRGMLRIKNLRGSLPLRIYDSSQKVQTPHTRAEVYRRSAQEMTIVERRQCRKKGWTAVIGTQRARAGSKLNTWTRGGVVGG